MRRTNAHTAEEYNRARPARGDAPPDRGLYIAAVVFISSISSIAVALVLT